MTTKGKMIRKFGVRDEIGYVFGDMAGSFVNLFVDAYFLTFCTYVLGVEAGWMATLFLAARLFDAVNDPIIGSFPDRWTLGKSGDKFKPWIKLFMIPLALSGILCFWGVSFEGIWLHAWVAFVYIFYGMSYTGTSMPFGAMANVVTDDPIDRSKLSRARSIGGTIVGMTALTMVPVLCFDSESNIMPERFTIIAVVFGALSVISYLVLCSCTQERIHVEVKEGEKFEFKKALSAAVKNRPLLGVMLATIGSMLSITGSSQLNSYLFKEVYHRTDAIAILSLATIPMMFVTFPLIPRLVRKFGKRRVILVSAVWGVVFGSVKLFIRIENVYAYIVLHLLAQLGQVGFAMLIWALVSDCLDYSEWKNNFRSDGSMYSLYTFSRKIGSTVASAGVAAGLSFIGYVSGSNVVQSDAAVTGIYYLCNAVPVLTCILELIGIGLIFNLDLKTTNQMYEELSRRREKYEKN